MLKNGWDGNKTYTAVFITSLVTMGLLYLAILVDSVVTDTQQQETVNDSCEEVWYLCINVLCLGLCLGSLAVLWVNYREEMDKINKHSFSSGQVRSPLLELWVWMGVNTLAQIINLI